MAITVLHNPMFVTVHFKLVIKDPVFVLLYELVPVAVVNTDGLGE